METDADAGAVVERIEHTVLGPETTPDDVIAALDEAIEYGMRACIPPCYLDLADGYAPSVPLVTVIGFPHGQHATDVKCYEARAAWKAGADEVDLVLNVGRLRAGEDDEVRADVADVVAAVPIPVKVIVQAPRLSDEEKRRAAEIVADADADYLKTATGFADGGATIEDVELLSEYLPVKASGGIGSWEKAKAMFDAGAERIGASSGDVIAREYLAEQEGRDVEDVGTGESGDDDSY